MGAALATIMLLVTITACDLNKALFGEDEPQTLYGSKKPVDPPPLDPTPKPVQEESSPLTIRATATGPVIQFVITNNSQRAIPLTRDDFALLVPGGRRIIRYDPFTTNLEISPWPEIIRPGETLSGRAIFHEVQDPVTYRLVVNPRTGRKGDAAFTVITSPGALATATRPDTMLPLGGTPGQP
jgi:hypothetical protein